MTTLSIVAPSGKNIAEGRKTLEIRSWHPEKLPLTDLLIVENGRFLIESDDSDDDGRLVAMVDSLELRPWLPVDVEAACASRWEPGYWAWCISNVRPVSTPARTRAARKLYGIAIQPADLARLIVG